MQTYKRNQVEEAVTRVFAGHSETSPSELHTRIKRLLGLDRDLGRKPRLKDAARANFAFFSDEGPGRGADISFSEYESFALLNALRMMEHGWPQGFAVSLLRRGRSQLEQEHARILRRPPAEDTPSNENPVAGEVPEYPGQVLLTVLSNADRAPDQPKGLLRLCHSFEESMTLLRQNAMSQMTTFELTVAAHRLRHALAETRPRRRGRS